MAELEIREALRRAMTEEMERDDSIFLMGEEVAEYNGAYKVSKGMLEQFGPERVVDTPISEGGFAGLGIGAAMVGMRPIIALMTKLSTRRRKPIKCRLVNIRYQSFFVHQTEPPKTLRHSTQLLWKACMPISLD